VDRSTLYGKLAIFFSGNRMFSGRTDAEIKEVLQDRSEWAPSGCWIWTGGYSAGQPCLRSRRHKTNLAHHLSYLVYHGPFAEGLWVYRSCGDTRCVNPSHLILVSPSEGASWSYAQRQDRSKLGPTEIRLIRRRAAAGASTGELATAFGLSPSSVNRIVSRRTWRNVSP
jgi:hypothetical protein